MALLNYYGKEKHDEKSINPFSDQNTLVSRVQNFPTFTNNLYLALYNHACSPAENGVSIASGQPEYHITMQGLA